MVVILTEGINESEGWMDVSYYAPHVKNLDIGDIEMIQQPNEKLGIATETKIQHLK